MVDRVEGVDGSGARGMGAVESGRPERSANGIGLPICQTRELLVVGTHIDVGNGRLIFETDFVILERLYGRKIAGGSDSPYAIVEVVEVRAVIRAYVRAHIVGDFVVGTDRPSRRVLVVMLD